MYIAFIHCCFCVLTLFFTPKHIKTKTKNISGDPALCVFHIPVQSSLKALYKQRERERDRERKRRELV
jgi:hypothetical protein